MGTKNYLDWSKRTVLVVTGASRGLGRCIATRFAEKLNPLSCILLVARHRKNLESVVEEIISRSPVKKVVPLIFDLKNADVQNCSDLLEKGLEEAKYAGSIDQAILVNNAGTLGNASQLGTSLTSATEVDEYFKVNLHSAMYLTSAFLSKFKKSENCIVNISSLCALQPFKGCSLYCTAKAARDMFFRVLAEEDESLIVLNYSPGPLLTDMLTEMLNTALPEVKQKYYDEEGKLRALTCDFTVSKLISVLENSKFKSGDHVDVFDCD